MEGLGAYSSDEDANDDGKSESRKSGSETDSSNDELPETRVESHKAMEVKIEPPASQKQPETKKRKLINPFQAMSSVKPSFLKSSNAQPEEDVVPVIIEPEKPQSTSSPAASIGRQSAQIEEDSASSSQAGLKKSGTSLRTDNHQAEDSKKKQETVRQKNNRKEKLGQAKFTLKANRDCPDIWRGT